MGISLALGLLAYLQLSGTSGEKILNAACILGVIIVATILWEFLMKPNRYWSRFREGPEEE